MLDLWLNIFIEFTPNFSWLCCLLILMGKGGWGMNGGDVKVIKVNSRGVGIKLQTLNRSIVTGIAKAKRGTRWENRRHKLGSTALSDEGAQGLKSNIKTK